MMLEYENLHEGQLFCVRVRLRAKEPWMPFDATYGRDVLRIENSKCLNISSYKYTSPKRYYFQYYRYFGYHQYNISKYCRD